jgi:steroid 5-alpha reductase family enzyme|tara:strand:+ start:7073 stop:7987 length:915 start_codon:yes stop_codon:yes gene_type:complete
MKYFKPFIPFIACWILLFNSNNLQSIALINGIGQLVLFLFVVCIPIWKTGRMSYVDIGWPWGVTLIGLITYCQINTMTLSKTLIITAYILIGSRMGLGALKMWSMGLLKKEFTRYEYQKIRWEKSNKTNIGLAMQVEALSQGLANASFLAIPIFLMSVSPSTQLLTLEIIGFTICVLSIVFETVADYQKLKFLRKMKRQNKKNMVCDIGLWKYTRHPNYFAEWMVWNGLIIASIPSFIALFESEVLWIWTLIGIALLYTSRIMYITLVYLTGAVPSEYFSAQKRPSYKAYKRSTNIFFPGPIKK